MNFLKNRNLDFKRIQEATVLFAVACLTISYFGGYYLVITTIGHHSTLLREMAVMLLFFKVLITRYNKKEFVIISILLLLVFFNYKSSGNTRTLYSFLTICALKNIDLKRVFQVSLISSVFIVSLMGILALTGVTGIVSVTENFGRADIASEISEIETRYYMGYIHPNTWAQAMFAIMTFIVAVYYEKMDWKGILLLIIMNYVVYRLAVSRTCFIAGLAMIILMLWAKYGQRLFEFILIRIGIVAGVSIFWAIIFTVKADVENNLKWEIIDWRLFTGRIKQAQEYYERFGVSLFGEKIPDVLENGYILDMGYMRMLLENGVIIFCLMYLATMVLLIYAFKKKYNDIIILVITVCLYGIYENQAIAQIPANLYMYYVAEMLFENNSEKKIRGNFMRN